METMDAPTASNKNLKNERVLNFVLAGTRFREMTRALAGPPLPGLSSERGSAAPPSEKFAADLHNLSLPSTPRPVA